MADVTEGLDISRDFVAVGLMFNAFYNQYIFVYKGIFGARVFVSLHACTFYQCEVCKLDEVIFYDKNVSEHLK